MVLLQRRGGAAAALNSHSIGSLYRPLAVRCDAGRESSSQRSTCAPLGGNLRAARGGSLCASYPPSFARRQLFDASLKTRRFRVVFRTVFSGSQLIVFHRALSRTHHFASLTMSQSRFSMRALRIAISALWEASSLKSPYFSSRIRACTILADRAKTRRHAARRPKFAAYDRAEQKKSRKFALRTTVRYVASSFRTVCLSYARAFTLCGAVPKFRGI